MPASTDGLVEVGAGLAVGGVPVLDSSQVGNLATVAEPPQWVSANVTAGQNLNQAAGTLTTSTAVAFVGAPSVVTVVVNVHGILEDSTSGARVTPVVELWRTNGTPIHLASMAGLYVRDSQDAEETSANCVFYDLTPGTNPTYELRTRRDSTVTAALPVAAPSTFQAKADF